MSQNRIPEQPDKPSLKVVVVQTPLGMVKLALPVSLGADGEDPLHLAMETFQKAVDSGASDPLMETLIILKGMADAGTPQPLVMGLAILKQMAEGGMLPPMKALIEGTGITQAFVDKALGEVAPNMRGLFDKLDSIYLN